MGVLENQLARRDGAADNFVETSWEQEFLGATPILGQHASPIRDVLGALCLKGDAELIPGNGRLIRVGQSVSIQFRTTASSFDAYLVVNVLSPSVETEVGGSDLHGRPENH